MLLFVLLSFDTLRCTCRAFNTLDITSVHNLYRLLIAKGYGVQATTIEGKIAFAPTLCFAQVSCDRWSKHM